MCALIIPVFVNESDMDLLIEYEKLAFKQYMFSTFQVWWRVASDFLSLWFVMFANWWSISCQRLVFAAGDAKRYSTSWGICIQVQSCCLQHTYRAPETSSFRLGHFCVWCGGNVYLFLPHSYQFILTHDCWLTQMVNKKLSFKTTPEKKSLNFSGSSHKGLSPIPAVVLKDMHQSSHHLNSSISPALSSQGERLPRSKTIKPSKKVTHHQEIKHLSCALHQLDWSSACFFSRESTKGKTTPAYWWRTPW